MRCRGMGIPVVALALVLACCALSCVAVVSHAVPAAATSGGYPDGAVAAFGDAATLDPLTGVPINSPVVAMVAVPVTHIGPSGSGSGAPPAVGDRGTGPLSVVTVLPATAEKTPSGAITDPDGFWLAAADGGVFSLGGAPYYGSAGGIDLQAPIVAMAATPTGKGYWLAALDGGIFAFGTAHFYGSMGGTHLNQPIVGMAVAPHGTGYWLVAADGGIFGFGTARYYGSMGGTALAAPVTAMAALPTGGGYWLVGADGGIFTFGTASFYGSLGDDTTLPVPVVAMAAAAGGKGYWLLGLNGYVWAYGTADTFGSPPDVPRAAPYASIVPTPGGGGYWLLEPDDFDYSFAHPGPTGGYPAIVAAAASQVGPDPDTGYFCNPYGPCEEWCALFATWAWRQSGVPIPSYGFTGDIYDWAASYGRVLAPTQTPVAGDAVLYGSGPWSTATSLHTGIVMQVWPDGAIDTVEGDAGPSVTGHQGVLINGPFLPQDSAAYNGMPIYAFAQP